MSSEDQLVPQQLPTAGSDDPTKIRENPLHAAETVHQPVPVEAIRPPPPAGRKVGLSLAMLVVGVVCGLFAVTTVVLLILMVI